MVKNHCRQERIFVNYTLSISEKQEFIICRVTGPLTIKVAKEFAKEIDNMSRAHNIKRFLKDMRGAPIQSSSYQIYEYTYEYMTNLGFQKDTRSAILVDPPDQSHNFVETVASNAGFTVKVFSDRAAAIAWLKE